MIRPSICRRIEQRLRSTRIPLLHIISLPVAFGRFETLTEWQFEGHMYFEAGHLPAGQTYEDAVRAAVDSEEQYLPTFPVPVHRMEFFDNLAAEPDRELLKLPI